MCKCYCTYNILELHTWPPWWVFFLVQFCRTHRPNFNNDSDNSSLAQIKIIKIS